jgi:plasmid replication initiation protein
LKQWLASTPAKRKPRKTVKKHDYLVRNAMFKLSAMGQKLVLFGFSMLPDLTPDFPMNDIEARKIKFSYSEFCDAIGIDINSGSTFEEVKDTINHMADANVFLPRRPGDTRPGFDRYNWFENVGWDNDITGGGYMVFTPTLLERMLEIKYFYAPVILKEVGELKGEYAIRQYEIARSHETEMGKYGNKEGEWSATFALSELRLLFGIEKGKYKQDRDFLKRAVINPSEEVNEAWFNFKIDHEKIKQGRSIVSVRMIYSKRTEKEIQMHKIQEIISDKNNKQEKKHHVG